MKKITTILLIGLIVVALGATVVIAKGFWVTKAPITTPRVGYGANQVEGIFYYIAGQDANGDTAINEAYDPVSDTWETKEPLPDDPRAGAVAVSDGSYVYLIGGRPVGTVGSDLWRYDPISDSWTSLTPMPTARATEHMAVHHGGRIFVIGGRTGDTPDALGVLDTLEVYKIAEDTWVTKTPMPEARSDAAVVKHGNKIYVFGGYDETGIATDTTFIYRIAKDTWTEGEPMPEPRANPVKGKCGNKIHIIGGYDLTGTPTTTHFVYNPVKDRWSDWSDSDPALSETAEVQGISHGGRIYVVGGGITETDTPNDINQVFKCAP